MNLNNLHELINKYESGLSWIYGTEHFELFKWQALKTWREEWFKPADSFVSFAERFTAAKRNFGLFIDNSRMHPSAGVLKLWEKEPETVEHLFNNVLFADSQSDADVVQTNMDNFLKSYEALRKKYFAGNWSYKQDRHSASVFLALMEPEFNFVYKSMDALMMARYIEADVDIGFGQSFSLKNYYRMCYEIIAALREHDTLLEKHFNYLGNDCYVDKSLHILAFDIMYCSRTYHFYKDLVPPKPKAVKRTMRKSVLSQAELEQREAERLAQIASLERELEELESVVDDCEDISLIGVEVSSKQYGIGTVVGQEVNKIVVQFENSKNTFILDESQPMRPRFEDDETVIQAFTAYGRRQKSIANLKRQLDFLIK